MKRRLLLSLAGIVAISASAQQKFEEPFKLGTPKKIKFKKELNQQKTANITGDDSYYYYYNNMRYTHEINDYLGTTSPSEGGSGYDTLGLYTYTVKEKMLGTTPYWQKLYQGIPNKANLSLNSLDFLVQGLKVGGSDVNVTVYEKDGTTVIESKDVTFTETYGYQTVTFDSPATSNDTMLVVLSMKTAADSVDVARSHNYLNGLDILADGNTFQSALPFGDAAVLAFEPNNSGYLGLIKADFDFFIVPNFSYDLTANFNTSNLTICAGEDVTFTNAGETSHVYNPILNYISWNYIVNDVAPVYTIFDYEGNATNSYVNGQVGSNTYATSGTYNATAGLMTYPWASPDLVIDPQSFTITVSSTSATVPSFSAIAPFCEETTAPTLSSSSNEAITGTWSPATVDNATIGTTTYTFTSDAGQCANGATLVVTVNDCASLEENNVNAFTLFPNPANDVVTVSLANAIEGNITLLSADGKVIETREVSSSVETFNVKSLNSGVYFFQVGQTIQKLMVK